jgi:hypothetical protein
MNTYITGVSGDITAPVFVSSSSYAGNTVVDIVALGAFGTSALNTLFLLGNNLQVYSCCIQQHYYCCESKASCKLLKGIKNPFLILPL